MKAKFLIPLFLLTTSFLQSQVFPVETVVNNGLATKRIKFVFLSDGYTTAQLPNFMADVTNFKDNLFTQPPFSNYKNFFNIYAIKVPSVESGADHPGTAGDESSSGGQPVLVANTYFNSTFDYGGIHRLVVPQNNVAINNVMSTNFPSYNQIFVFANSTFYGGSGGSVAASTVNVSSKEVSIHEIGHSFAVLADEYAIGGQGERPNRTKETNPALVKWKSWIGSDNIGIFPVGSESWQRPHQNCKMQFLGVPFCSVCTEAFVNTIYNQVTPIYSFLPAISASPISVTTNFSANLTLPIPNTLTTEWKLNGNSIATSVDNVNINPTILPDGNSILTLFVTDKTTLSRSYLPASGYVFSQTWTLTKVKTSPIQTVGKSDKFYYQIAPNPARENIVVSGNTDYKTDLQIELFNEVGKMVYRSNLKEINGAYQQTIPLSNLSNGVYIVALNLPNGYVVREKIVKVE